MANKKDFRSFSAYLLAEEAESRGINVEGIFPDKGGCFCWEMALGEYSEIAFNQRISRGSYAAFKICRNKEITRRFLRRAGISVMDGGIFGEDEAENALKFALKIGFPVVIKPVGETHGKGVYIDINSEEEFLDALEKVLEGRSRFLVEKQFHGEEFRVLASKDKVMGVISRIPANVVGDGEKTIKELIEEKNSDNRRGDGHEKSLVKIKINDITLENLKNQGLNIEDVLEQGKTVFLRNVSNISQGGDSIDFTDKVHPRVKELASEVVRAIPGLPYAGIDFMTPDIAMDPEEVGYAIIEINDAPMLSMHHVPYEGQKRNVAGDIIDIIFPETK